MKVLISGAGIAGLTLAYWLLEQGHEPVVIERAPDLRTGGYLIDFAGSGCDVAAWMGLTPQLQEYDTGLTEIRYHNRHDKVVARLDMQRLYAAAHVTNKFYSLDRRDLVKALYDVVKDRCDVRFGITIQDVGQNERGANVIFDNNTGEFFDLVIGADGIHSHTRSLIFGKEAQFTRDLGYHFAIFYMPNSLVTQAHHVQLYVEPGLQAGIYPLEATRALVFLTYRSDEAVPKQDQHLILQRKLAHAGWRVPKILAQLDAETPIFMDSVTQVELPSWSQARIALIGDAAYCPTLVSGQGASMAMAGAYLLAQALQRHEDYPAAFAQYERWLRPHITQIQTKARNFAPTFIPNNGWRIFLTHWAIKLIDNPLVARFVGKQFSIDSIFDAGELARLKPTAAK